MRTLDLATLKLSVTALLAGLATSLPLAAALAAEPVANNPVKLNVLTTAEGATLYVFDRDLPNESKCEGPCALKWPPFLLAEGAEAPAPGDLGTFSRADGSAQFAWKGRPLYTFADDQAPGDANGSELGGLWHVQALLPPPPPPLPVVSGCAETDYVDGADGAVITTGAGGYTPRCLRVKAGSTVTITGSSFHPLQGMVPVGGLANPFVLETESKVAVTRKLDQAGVLGYYCIRHGKPTGEGMAGAIQIVP